MKVELDDSANAAYAKLKTGRVAKTKKSKIESLDVLLDYDKAGNLLGIELLNLKELVELFLSSKIGKTKGHRPKSKTAYSYSALQTLPGAATERIEFERDVREMATHAAKQRYVRALE